MAKNKDIDIQNSKLIFKNIMKHLCYEETQMFFGKSFIYECSFYKTEFENVFITDYDFSKDYILLDKTCVAFSPKTGKHVKITFEFIEQAEKYFKDELKLLLIK